MALCRLKIEKKSEKSQIESVKLWLTYESYKYESYLIRKPVLVWYASGNFIKGWPPGGAGEPIEKNT